MSVQSIHCWGGIVSAEIDQVDEPGSSTAGRFYFAGDEDISSGLEK